nr:pyrroline-5-carboxylate reductase [Desulfobacterales bacterium]
MKRLDKKIGFIGAGNMAEAMINGLLESGLTIPSQISASDIRPDRLAIMSQNYAIETIENNTQIFKRCDVVILAVKPQQMNHILEEIADLLTNGLTTRKLVISIAAGVPIRKIEQYLYRNLDDESAKLLPIVRVMPNTPALVQAGMAGMSGNRYAGTDDLQTVHNILKAIGEVIEFEEKDLHAVTALSGSGPAYVYYFIESLLQGAKELGLKRSDALTLTLTTIKGAIKLLEEAREDARVLRNKVTSPGGTTEAALKVLEDRKVGSSIREALKAAANRSVELSS